MNSFYRQDKFLPLVLWCLLSRNRVDKGSFGDGNRPDYERSPGGPHVPGVL